MMTASRLNGQPVPMLLPSVTAQALSTIVASNLFFVSAYKPALERTLAALPPRVGMALHTVFPFLFFRWKGWL